MIRRRARAASWLMALLGCLLCPWTAATPDERLEDPLLEGRARALSRELRCVVCQNQTIDDSDAPLARDLRLLLRERLQSGDTDEQVLAYLVARYGNFVLLRPPVKANTLLLWLGPAGLLIAALGGFGLYLRGRRSAQATEAGALTDAEQARLASLLDDLDARAGRCPESDTR